MIDGLYKWSAIFSGMFVYLGYCNLKFYFCVFGINIENYIKTSEILMQILPLSLENIYLIGIFLFEFFLLERLDVLIRKFYNSNLKLISNDFKFTNVSKVSSKVFFREFFKSYLMLFVFILVFGILILEFLKNDSNKYTFFRCQIVELYLGLNLIYIVIRLLVLNIKVLDVVNGKVIFSILIFCFSLFVIKKRSNLSAEMVLSREYLIDMEITTKTRKYKTGELLCFIGSTESCIFLFNFQNSKVIVLKRADVEKEEISNSLIHMH